jgi:hypothetical protein
VAGSASEARIVMGSRTPSGTRPSTSKRGLPWGQEKERPNPTAAEATRSSGLGAAEELTSSETSRSHACTPSRDSAGSRSMNSRRASARGVATARAGSSRRDVLHAAL